MEELENRINNNDEKKKLPVSCKKKFPKPKMVKKDLTHSTSDSDTSEDMSDELPLPSWSESDVVDNDDFLLVKFATKKKCTLCWPCDKEDWSL
ncbi:hypothetical protein PR048_005900 [Dryococelus australis]|uniref:Uncharacterized protein n=1 Tax=Dryococelus australis TaxID=614101 RepID=A0ABQ9I9H4_9NEOP|nr:hypothetical protein PR048_005900 [Dryococelus australis]